MVKNYNSDPRLLNRVAFVMKKGFYKTNLKKGREEKGRKMVNKFRKLSMPISDRFFGF